MGKNYHCCATCKHFSAGKKPGGGMHYHCVRLGFETKPTYTFNCWNPTDTVKRLMKKEED